jgi:hypothetical protein
MKTFLSTMLVLLSVLASACGGEETPDPMIMRIDSANVVQTAVDQIEIVIRPVAAAQMFEMMPDRMFYGGQINTHVTMAGEYVITLDRLYIDTHAVRPADTTIQFRVDLPISAEGHTDDPTISDPSLEVFFRRMGACPTEQDLCRIGRAQRFFPYPLVPVEGPEVTAPVMCISPAHDLECTNNDPPTPDAGM